MYPYLDVVDSERQVLDAKRSLIELLGQRYAATVQLIKSLGGCWKAECSVNNNSCE
jgi:multidrug efflux system outer membrane protein